MSAGALAVPQWYYDQTDMAKATGIGYASKPQKVVRPAVFGETGSTSTKTVKKGNEDNLKVKRAWELALGPAKSLPMNVIMSYFSGNSLQIVTVSMTAYMFFLSPLSQIMGVNNVFKGLDGPNIRSDILVTKIVYVLCSLLMVAVGVWKVGQMGLLPTHQGDWMAWQDPAEYVPVFGRP